MCVAIGGIAAATVAQIATVATTAVATAVSVGVAAAQASAQSEAAQKQAKAAQEAQAEERKTLAIRMGQEQEQADLRKDILNRKAMKAAARVRAGANEAGVYGSTVTKLVREQRGLALEGLANIDTEISGRIAQGVREGVGITNRYTSYINNLDYGAGGLAVLEPLARGGSQLARDARGFFPE